MQSLVLYKSSIFTMLSLACVIIESLVFHPSICELIMVRFDAVVCAWVEMVETVGFHHVLWIVMVESAKD
jgi:hypothetical protein